jgi:trk/ktr system potassium uptake protein
MSPKDKKRPNRVAVIGLGRFGLAAGKALAERGLDVIGIDRSERVIQETKDELPLVVQAQLHEENVVRELGLHETDAAIIAIGDDAQASIFIATLLVEAGVPNVIARAHTPLHGLILERVGAHLVLYPESEGGEALARNLLAPGAGEQLSLSAGVCIIKVRTPAASVGRSIHEVQHLIGERFRVLVIQRGASTLAPPSPEERLQDGDVLALLGDEGELSRVLIALERPHPA